MASSMGSSLVLRVALLLGAVAVASSGLIAVDLGSEYLKISLIKPGRTPISIVVNEVSKRKSPALVSFVNDERLVGEESLSMAVRFPDTTIQMARDLLGKSHDDPTILHMVKNHALPYKVVEHPTRKVAAVQVTEDLIVGAEELVASVLQYVKRISEEYAGSSVPDVVLTVPAWFGQAQRHAYMAAGELAGFNVLGVINSHTAAALQYGIERDFSNRTENIVLYDMGSGSTEVALIRYSSYTIKEAGKPKQLSQLEVRDVDWDHQLGCNQLDVMLSDHFAAVFAAKNKINLDEVKVNTKAMAKLKKQVRRTKEILSANTAAPMSVEEFYNGIDFQTSITREEFETMAADFFSRAAAPLLRVLERSGLKLEDITGVELLGGGTRVPKLQAVLSEALSGRVLDRHLDSDEATAMGAGLFAANLSTSFRLRKFGMTDLSMYGIEMHTHELHQEPPVPLEDGSLPEETPTVRALLPYMKKLPIKRVVHFSNLTKGPIRFSLSYNTSTHHGLPPGVSSHELAEFEITGIEKAIERYNVSGIVNLRFQADVGGVLQLDKAEAVVDYIVMEEKIVEIKVPSNATNSTGNSTNSTNTTNTTIEDDKAEADTEGEKAEGADVDDDEDKSTEEADSAKSGKTEGDGEVEDDSSDDIKAEDSTKEDGVKSDSEGGAAAANATDANATDSGVASGKNTTSSVKRILVPKHKTAKVTLTIGGKKWLFPTLTGEHLKSAEDILDAWSKAEGIKREMFAAKNDLEAYIIKMQDVVSSDEELIKVTTEEQRSAFTKSLTATEDWLYEDGEHETGPEFRKRLQALKDIGAPMQRRASELTERPRIVTAALEAVELNSKVVNMWPETKPWITENETTDITKKLEEFSEWLKKMEEEQAMKADHEDPAFSTDDVKNQYQKVDKLYHKVSNKRKPKPPPEPPANKTKTNETAGNNTEEGADAKDGSKAEDADVKTDPKSEEEKAKKDKEEKAKKDKEEKAKKEKDAKAKKDKDAKAKKEDAKAKKDKDAKAKKDKEAKAKKEKDTKAKKEEKAKKEKAKKSEL